MLGPSGPAMRALLLSMPDSFEHTPALTMRMPSDASAPFGIRIVNAGVCSNESGIERSRALMAGPEGPSIRYPSTSGARLSRSLDRDLRARRDIRAAVPRRLRPSRPRRDTADLRGRSRTAGAAPADPHVLRGMAR